MATIIDDLKVAFSKIHHSEAISKFDVNCYTMPRYTNMELSQISDYCALLCYAFDWETSPEGQEYWHIIHMRLCEYLFKI
jgi:hypothetical protein